MSIPGVDQVQAQAADAMKQGQDAATAMASTLSENWSNALRAMSGQGVSGVEGMPNPGEMIDRMYDAGVQVLEVQRAFAHSLLGAMVPGGRG